MDETDKKISSYKSLLAYRKSECVFDITYYWLTGRVSVCST